VVEPTRSDGGQRLYSDADVERLSRLRRLSDAGRSISQVAALGDEEAELLLREDQAQRPERVAMSLDRESDAHRTVESAFQLVLDLDGEGLEAVLRRSAATLGAYPFLEDVVAVLLHEVGTAWTRDELFPAQEHLCTEVVERVLGWLADPSGASPGSPRLVVATLPGERHGLGARLVSASAVLEGWHVIHLGVDLPVRDVARAARAVGARAVALSMVNAEAAQAAPGALKALRESLPEGTAVVLGGGAAGRLDVASLPPRVEVARDLTGLRAVLERLR
jgi:methanogenic corrinoid protein MtbC1